MKQGPIPGVNIAHNTASKGYRRGELDDDSTPVNRPLNIAHNTLPQVFARMGLLPHSERRGPLLGCWSRQSRSARLSSHVSGHPRVPGQTVLPALGADGVGTSLRTRRAAYLGLFWTRVRRLLQLKKPLETP